MSRRTVCPKHGTPLRYSLVGVGFCPACRALDRPEIVALVRPVPAPVSVARVAVPGSTRRRAS